MMRASVASCSISARIGESSLPSDIQTSRTRRRPATSSSRTAWRPSTRSPPRPFGPACPFSSREASGLRWRGGPPKSRPFVGEPIRGPVPRGALGASEADSGRAAGRLAGRAPDRGALSDDGPGRPVPPRDGRSPPPKLAPPKPPPRSEPPPRAEPPELPEAPLAIQRIYASGNSCPVARPMSRPQLSARFNPTEVVARCAAADCPSWGPSARELRCEADGWESPWPA